jgi:sorting nexin-29
MNSLILFGIEKNFPDGWKDMLLYQFTERMIQLNVLIIMGYYYYQLHTKILLSVLVSRLSPYIDEIIEEHHCVFQCNRLATSQIFCVQQMLEMKGECNETVYQLFIDFKKAYDLMRREVLCSVLIEFGVPLKLIRLIEMCLN